MKIKLSSLVRPSIYCLHSMQMLVKTKLTKTIQDPLQGHGAFFWCSIQCTGLQYGQFMTIHWNTRTLGIHSSKSARLLKSWATYKSSTVWMGLHCKNTQLPAKVNHLRFFSVSTTRLSCQARGGLHEINQSNLQLSLLIHPAVETWIGVASGHLGAHNAHHP